MSKENQILTKSDAETKKLGVDFAKKIMKPHFDGSRTSFTSFKEALVISLEGDLGAGKTTFTQGFAKGLGIKEKIQSPTFVIMRIHEITPLNPPYFKGEKKNKTLPPYEGGRVRDRGYMRYSNFIHVYAYRLKSKDFAVLNWKEFIKNPQNIILVEWGNKIKNILPKNSIRVIFSHVDNNKRLIKVVE